MYISNKPHAPRQMASEYAGVDAADAASAEPASSCRPGDQENRSPPPGQTLHVHEPSPSSSSNPSSSASGPLPGASSIQGRTSFPVSFSPIFFQRSKVPSASLAPSTAEGKPVPVTDPTDAHRTSALQKLNSKYPSAVRRHGYTPEAPSAQSSTYSQPVLVRTYSGPPLSQGSRSSQSRQYRPPSTSRGVSRRVPLPSASTPGSSVPGQPVQPAVSGVGVSTTSSINTDTNGRSLVISDTNATVVNMPRPYKPKKAITSSSKLPLPWRWHSRQEPEEPKLPPLEAFSFKSFMADLQAPGGDNDISADLDRIAEICARSRYSLSNQYEVHVAPHSSGASFMSGAGPSPSSVPRRKGHSRSRSHGHGSGGPTLQAIPSDDEASSRSHPRRRNGRQRRSAAYGTLETIMSSSRSSEEDKTKKKSAAELAGEVRGRAARKAWDNNPSTSASGSASASAGNSNSNSNTAGSSGADAPTPNPNDNTALDANANANAKLARKKSSSFATAIMETSNNSSGRSSGKIPSSTTTASGGSSSRRNSNNGQQNRQRAAAATTSGSSSSSTAAAAALISEPARPQTSGSHLGVRTAPVSAPTLGGSGGGGAMAGLGAAGGGYPGGVLVERGGTGDGGLPHQAATPATSTSGVGATGSSWGGWIPWRSGVAQGQGHGGGHARERSVSNAEGSLRSLLRGGGGGGGGEGQVGRAVGR